MHIEPGIVDGTKIVLSYATAAAAGGYAVKLAADTAREQGSGLAGGADGRDHDAGLVLLRNPAALLGRRLRGAFHLRLDLVPDLRRGARGAGIGARPAAAGHLPGADRPAAIRHERHDPAGAAVCDQRARRAHRRPRHRLCRSPLWPGAVALDGVSGRHRRLGRVLGDLWPRARRGESCRRSRPLRRPTPW